MGANKKNKTIIRQRIRRKAFEKRIRRRNKRRLKNKHNQKRRSLPVPRKFRRLAISYSNPKNNITSSNLKRRSYYINKYLPPNLKYLVHNEASPFHIDKLKVGKYKSGGIIKIPKVFSIVEDQDSSIETIKRVLSALLYEDISDFKLDYEECEKVGLGSQILLDIILKDFKKFTTICHKIDRRHDRYFPATIGGINIKNENIQKMIFSVGSPVTLKVKEFQFDDVIPYKLCIHDNEKEKDLDRRIEQKELDTTELADYVLDSLKRMKKTLTPEKLDDLCTVIGEILINAEEHSSTKYRFSIGYFKEENTNEAHYGIFRLVILNFGQTIYEKFSAADCQNKEIVAKMKELSKSYTKRNMFLQREFEEENLWTLYALQEGVSSVSPTDYKRGNGSIRFIESFFNIKESKDADNISRMTILSGKTQISFDGKYEIVSKVNSLNEPFRVMTFNNSGNIEDKPDNKYVFQTKHYFPGTLISAKILLNDDDVMQLNN